MRTSINLDQDIHDFASSYAAANYMTLSAAVNTLLRRAEESLHEPRNTAGLEEAPYGFLVFPKTGSTITSEMVKQILEDTDD